MKTKLLFLTSIMQQIPLMGTAQNLQKRWKFFLSIMTFFFVFSQSSYGLTIVNNSGSCDIQVWCLEHCGGVELISNMGILSPGSSTVANPTCQATIRMVPVGTSPSGGTAYAQTTCPGGGSCSGTISASPTCATAPPTGGGGGDIDPEIDSGAPPPPIPCDLADAWAANGGPLSCNNPITSLTAFAWFGTGYFWTGPNGFTDTGTYVLAYEPGTYTVTMNTGDGSGCSTTATTIVEGDPNPPNASASNNGPLTCENESTQIFSTVPTGASYSWSGPNGFNSNEQNPIVTAAGTYKLTVTNSIGCTNTAKTKVQTNVVEVNPTANNDGPLTCTNTSTQLSISGLIPTEELNFTGNNDYDYSYSWSGPNGYVSNEANPIVTEPGDYSVTVSIAECTGTASTTLASEIVDINLTIDNSINGPLTCDNTSLQLTASGGQNYAWTGPNGFASNQSNPTITEPGIYTVTANNDGCDGTASIIIEEDIAIPNAQASNDGPLTCDNTNIQLSASGEGTYTWTGPNAFSSNQQNPIVSVAGSYSVTVTNDNGCTNTASTTVIEDTEAPTAFANNSGPLPCSTSTVMLTASGGESFSWTGPNGYTSNEQNPTISAPGTYTVNVTNSNGCTDSFSTTVTEESCLIDLELNKSVDKPQVNVGENVVWTISVINEGPGDATGVSVGDFLPDGVTYINSNVSQGAINPNNLFWNIGNIAVNQTVTLNITTSVDQAGTFINMAEIIAANEEDIDSTPNNMGEGPNEDDEDDAVTEAAPILGSLGDFVFVDSNENGIQDNNEPGIEGVIVMLLNDQGDMIDQTTTDANGNYLFDELPAGDYKIKFPVNPTIDDVDYALTASNQGFNDALDSDAVPMAENAGNSMTQIYTLEAGQHNPTIDAGYIIVEDVPQTAGLGNYTFQDFNDNGMFDSGEEPLAMVWIYLYNADNLEIAIDSTVSDENGFYEFTNLDPNIDYIVQFESVKGFTRSSPSFPSSEGLDDKNDASFFTGFTNAIDLDPGEFDPTIDAGYVPFRGVQGLAVIQGPAIPMGDGKPGTGGNDATQFKSNGLAWQMVADLVKEDMVPTSDPYSNLSAFTHINNDFGLEAVNPDLLTYTGEPDDIVDWVFVELRNVDDPKVVVTTRSILLQANGQLVDKEGNTDIELNADYGQYYVALRHRNHLGVMTAEPVIIGGSEIPMIDFTNPNVATWGTNAQVMLDANTRALWAGDANMDGNVVFQGEGNDNTDGFFDVLSDPANTSSQITFIASGYLNSDINMNCQSVYQGGGNDNDKKFFNILLHPDNTLGVLNFIIEEQLEK